MKSSLYSIITTTHTSNLDQTYLPYKLFLNVGTHAVSCHLTLQLQYLTWNSLLVTLKCFENILSLIELTPEVKSSNGHIFRLDHEHESCNKCDMIKHTLMLHYTPLLIRKNYLNVPEIQMHPFESVENNVR